MNKINCIKIKNYKSIKEMVLKLNEDLNVFVGPNNSGKSNILNCVFEIVNIEEKPEAIKSSMSRLNNYERRNPYIEVKTSNNEVFGYNNLSRSSNRVYYKKGGAAPSFDASATSNINEKISVAKVDSYIDINKVQEDMYEFFDGLDDGEISVLLSYINHDLMIISNEFYSLSIANNKLFVADSYGDTALIEEKSNGVKKLVFMSYFLNKFNIRHREMPDIIIFDEPEAHLHIQAQRYLYKKIKEVFSGKQIIISTHSTAFINDTDLDKVFLVDRSPFEGTYIDYNKKDRKKLLKINEIMGINLLDTLGMDINITLVMVEGKTDKFYHDYVYHRLFPTKKKKFVEVEGANKITDFISVYKEIFPMTPTGILDYDNKGLDMASKIKSKFENEFDNKIILNNEILIKNINENEVEIGKQIEVEDLLTLDFLKEEVIKLIKEELQVEKGNLEIIENKIQESSNFKQMEEYLKKSEEFPKLTININYV